jgi:hypothetical protein
MFAETTLGLGRSLISVGPPLRERPNGCTLQRSKWKDPRVTALGPFIDGVKPAEWLPLSANTPWSRGSCSPMYYAMSRNACQSGFRSFRAPPGPRPIGGRNAWHS